MESQKSEHRPFRSQSPKRVGSGPRGPPISPVALLTCSPPSSSPSSSSLVSRSSLIASVCSLLGLSWCGWGCWVAEHMSRVTELDKERVIGSDLVALKTSFGVEERGDFDENRIRLAIFLLWLCKTMRQRNPQITLRERETRQTLRFEWTVSFMSLEKRNVELVATTYFCNVDLSLSLCFCGLTFYSLREC